MSLTASLTTNCPWCGRDGVRVQVRLPASPVGQAGQAGQTGQTGQTGQNRGKAGIKPGGRLRALLMIKPKQDGTTSSQLLDGSWSTDRDKIGKDIESIIMMLKMLKRGTVHVEFKCLLGCSRSAVARESVLPLLNRVIYGHDGTVREKVKSLPG